MQKTDLIIHLKTKGGTGMATLSIVLPSYNEEQNIAHTAQTLSELLTQEKIDYELVFVSDGS